MTDPAVHPDPGDPPRSGLANPERAVRSLGAMAMVLEGITLLLAIQPIRMLASGDTAAAVVFLIAAAVVAFVLAGMMKRAWAWHAAGVLQVVLIAGVFAHWTVAAIGLIFGLGWLYILKVRRTILS